jgi:streptomycin 6-kinase
VGSNPIVIPDRLKWLSQHKAGASWLADLPKLVSELTQAWGLQLGTPYDGAGVSFVAPAARDAKQFVLKVQWPHDECAHEADALRVWNGIGADRLLAHDPARHALLLERCVPGTQLAAAVGVDPLAVVIDLLPRLWRTVGAPFKPLTDEAKEWATDLHADWNAAGRRCERKLIDAAAEFLDHLPTTQGEQVLVHQDLHGDNILAAEREPWLVIDPKPLAAEREFSLAPIIRSFEFGHSKVQVVYRLDRLSAELRLDRSRVRQWAIAQTVAWSFDSAYADQHFETARWLLAANWRGLVWVKCCPPHPALATSTPCPQYPQFRTSQRRIGALTLCAIRRHLRPESTVHGLFGCNVSKGA